MQVQQMIRNSAQVLTITHLSPGDCYKRVTESTTYSQAALVFGVVQDVMNNGEDAAVTALEYVTDYTTGVKATLQVFDGGKPAAIYPATPDEVAAHVDDLERYAIDAQERAQADLDKRTAAVRAVQRLRDQMAAASLQAPATADHAKATLEANDA